MDNFVLNICLLFSPFLVLHTAVAFPEMLPSADTSLCVHLLIFAAFSWILAVFLWIVHAWQINMDEFEEQARQCREELIRLNIQYCESAHFKNTLWDHVLDRQSLYRRKTQKLQPTASWNGSTRHSRSQRSLSMDASSPLPTSSVQ